MAPTGDDINDALELIEANGGVGDWEEAGDDVDVQRYLFPRFHGADSIGTCSDEDGNVPNKKHEGVHVRNTKCGANWAPDAGNMYLSRSGIGPNDTDVETLVSWLAAPRNIVGAIMLLGEPGTGKTALIEAAATHAGEPEDPMPVTTVVCTPDHTRDSLFMKFMGEGRGDCVVHGHNHVEGADDFTDACERSPFTLGPIPYAAKHGHLLYMDEVMLLLDGVKPLLYPLSDGRRFLPEGNVDGTALEIHPDFRLVFSSNPMVRGASMPEPIASRCAGTTLTVETSAQMLLDLDIDESIVQAWQACKDNGLWHPQIREMRVADYWLSIDVTQAASAFLGEHCPESQREDVRKQVTSYMGGYLRNDGRLVVS